MTTDLTSEYATLGALLLAPKILAEVHRWLRPEDFAGPATRLTYSVILSLQARELPVDAVTVRAEMGKRGLVRRDGYPTMELARMLEAVPVPAAAAYYARLVLAESITRGVRAIGLRLQQLGSTPREPEDLFAAVAEQLRALDALRRRWNLAAGQEVAELPTGSTRDPATLQQALAELDPPWKGRGLVS